MAVDLPHQRRGDSSTEGETRPREGRLVSGGGGGVTCLRRGDSSRKGRTSTEGETRLGRETRPRRRRLVLLVNGGKDSTTEGGGTCLRRGRLVYGGRDSSIQWGKSSTDAEILYRRGLLLRLLNDYLNNSYQTSSFPTKTIHAEL
jgi:hypothetical protein